MIAISLSLHYFLGLTLLPTAFAQSEVRRKAGALPWLISSCATPPMCQCQTYFGATNCKLGAEPQLGWTRCEDQPPLQLRALKLQCSDRQTCESIDVESLVSTYPALAYLVIQNCSAREDHSPRDDQALWPQWRWQVKLDWTEEAETSDLVFFIDLKVGSQNLSHENIRSPCNLLRLRINHANLIRIPTTLIGRCRHLKVLDLSRNNIPALLPKDVEVIFFNKHLQIVDLSHNMMNDVGDSMLISMYDSLCRFLSHDLAARIAELQVGGDCGRRLASLERLFRGWSDMTILTPSIWNAIVKNLVRTYPNCSTSSLRIQFPLSELQIFNAFDNQLRDIPLLLTGMNKLSAINLQHNQITSKRNLKYCACTGKVLKALSLDHNRIKEMHGDSLLLFTGFHFVNLSFNSIEDFSLSAFSADVSLVSLELSHNKLITAHPFAFNFAVQHVSFANNMITFASLKPGPYGSLVETVDLSNNRISYVTDGSLRKAFSLRFISLSRNPLIIIDGSPFVTNLRSSWKHRVRVDLWDLPKTVQCDCNSIFNFLHVYSYGTSSLHYPYLLVQHHRQCHVSTGKFIAFENLTQTYCSVDGSIDLDATIKGAACNNKPPICPEGCRCSYTWTRSQVYVYCQNHTLMSVPAINIRATRIHFQFNNFGNIGTMVFGKCLRQLQRLYMESNNIHNMIPGLFKYLQNVKYLRLHSNFISHLSPRLFTGLRRVRYMDLKNNSITNPTVKVFKDLKSLKTLDLQTNPIVCNCKTTIDFLRWYTRFTKKYRLLPQNCSVAREIQNTMGGHTTIPYNINRVKQLCEAYALFQTEERRSKQHLILKISASVGTALLVFAVVTGLMHRKRASLRLFTDSHTKRRAVRSLFGLRNHHSKPFDVGFLYHERQSPQFHEIKRLLCDSPRANLEVVQMAQYLPGAARLQQISSLVNDIEVCAVIVSTDLLEDQYYSEALAILLFEFIRSKMQLSIILIIMDDSVFENKGWQVFSYHFKQMPLIMWSDKDFFPRLLVALPPPRPLPEVEQTCSTANLNVEA